MLWKKIPCISFYEKFGKNNGSTIKKIQIILNSSLFLDYYSIFGCVSTHWNTNTVLYELKKSNDRLLHVQHGSWSHEDKKIVNMESEGT